MNIRADRGPLNARVDTTLTRFVHALVDPVCHLSHERNTAYSSTIAARATTDQEWRVGGEGQKRFLLLGSRDIEPLSQLDPRNPRRIDRLTEAHDQAARGQYEACARQARRISRRFTTMTGTITGELQINEPETFGPFNFS